MLELQEYDDQLSRWEERDVPGPPRPPRPRTGSVLHLRVRNRCRSNVSLHDRLELQGEDEATLRELLVRYRYMYMYNHGLAVHRRHLCCGCVMVRFPFKS